MFLLEKLVGQEHWAMKKVKQDCNRYVMSSNVYPQNAGLCGFCLNFEYEECCPKGGKRGVGFYTHL